jgi:3-oxoacyl-[acyl-carrier protein] reductase
MHGMSEPQLQGRVALVTGASQGIGFAIAQALAGAGARVVISARGEERLRQAAERLEQRGGEVEAVPCDMRDAQAVERLVRAAHARWGRLDVLVNNAGVGGFGRVDELSVEKWRTVIGTNLDGVFYACRVAIPLLREQEESWIINIGSLAGRNAFAGGAAYNASKFGLLGFSEALMLDVRHDGIRVSCVMPGSVDTPFFDAEKVPERAWMLQGEDIARVVLDLLAFPGRALPSKVEIRPSAPPR